MYTLINNKSRAFVLLCHHQDFGQLKERNSFKICMVGNGILYRLQNPTEHQGIPEDIL